MAAKIICLGPGVSPHFQKFCSYMVKAGLEVFVYHDQKRILESYKPPAPSSGTPEAQRPIAVWKRAALLLARPLLETLGVWRDLAALRREAKRIEADLIHVHWLWKWGFPAVLTGLPVVLTAWGSDIEFPDHTTWQERRKMYFALRRAQAVTSPSAYMDDLLAQGGAPRARIRRVIFPGIDVGLFESGQATIPELRIPEAAPVILSPRALDPFYRIHVVIDAFAIFQKSVPDAILLLLDYNRDPPEYMGQIKEQIARQGLEKNVVLFENMPLPYAHMPSVYRRSALAISIPEGDGVPGSCLEAMAAGCPVITSNLRTYDGILDDGETCLRVASVEPRVIADACLRLFREPDLKQHLISAARGRVRQLGDVNIEMRKFVDLYKEIS